MGKYIIEVGDAYAEYICGKGDMLCLPVRINEFEDNWLNTNIPLTPYTEPDMEKVREEAYKRGREDAIDAISSKEQSIADKAYQSGLSDAWEAARKIAIIPYAEEEKAFGSAGWSFILNHTAQDAIDRLKAYEQKKQEEIKVGDEVEFYDGGTAIWMCDNPNEDAAYLMFSDGSCGSHENSEIIRKTGRHFPEIATVLQKMEEDTP